MSDHFLSWARRNKAYFAGTKSTYEGSDQYILNEAFGDPDVEMRTVDNSSQNNPCVFHCPVSTGRWASPVGSASSYIPEFHGNSMTLYTGTTPTTAGAHCVASGPEIGNQWNSNNVLKNEATPRWAKTTSDIDSYTLSLPVSIGIWYRHREAWGANPGVGNGFDIWSTADVRYPLISLNHSTGWSSQLDVMGVTGAPGIRGVRSDGVAEFEYTFPCNDYYNNDYQDTNWHWLVLTMNTSAASDYSGTRIYYDGIAGALWPSTELTAPESTVLTTLDVTVGAAAGASAGVCKYMDIGHACVWQEALTPEDIERMYMSMRRIYDFKFPSSGVVKTMGVNMNDRTDMQHMPSIINDASFTSGATSRDTEYASPLGAVAKDRLLPAADRNNGITVMGITKFKRSVNSPSSADDHCVVNLWNHETFNTNVLEWICYADNDDKEHGSLGEGAGFAMQHRNSTYSGNTSVGMLSMSYHYLEGGDSEGTHTRTVDTSTAEVNSLGITLADDEKDVFAVRLSTGSWAQMTKANGITAAATDGTPSSLPWGRQQVQPKIFEQVIAPGDNSTDRSTYGPLVVFPKELSVQAMKEGNRLANGLVPVRTRRPCTTLFRWSNLMSTSRIIK